MPKPTTQAYRLQQIEAGKLKTLVGKANTLSPVTFTMSAILGILCDRYGSDLLGDLQAQLDPLTRPVSDTADHPTVGPFS